MTVEQLIEDVETVKVIGNLQAEVSSLAIDSRKVVKGSLFAAMIGTAADGHNFIGKAVESGASAILCSTLPAETAADVTYILVKDTSKALGYVASAFYGEPSSRMIVVGVTGTNGKTTIATLLYKLFKKLGYKTGLISTICNMIDDEKVESTHTTPDQIELNALMAKMVEKGCSRVFMEVSSHSVVQNRIAGLNFDGGIFTNLTRDHLDYHGTMQEYLKAKKMFFDNLPSTAFALVNTDDKNGKVMVQNTKANVYTYSTTSLADFKCRIIEQSFDGMLLNINSIESFMQFTGAFNAANLTAVYGAAYLNQVRPVEILKILSSLTPVDGRFDKITSPDGKRAIVDYAHTPDALKKVIDTINDVRRQLPKASKLITVVGCGGNRDKGKRPMMAKIAVSGSDVVVITSDNPRNEEPMDIINDMTAGLSEEEMKSVLVIENRESAIKTARTMASTDDIILIAGKGHETYQEIKGVRHHFSDKEVFIR